jgi:16S rRNA processing protein RimM
MMAPEPARRPSGSAREPDEFLAVGRIVRPHGVRGALLVSPNSDLIRSLQIGQTASIGQGAARKVRHLRAHQRNLIITLEGIEDRDSAENYRGEIIYLPLDAVRPLVEGEYFYWQILGMAVFSEDGEELGQVADILETGANDVYVVRQPGARDLLLPAIAEVIRRVDLDERRLTVRLLPGLRE